MYGGSVYHVRCQQENTPVGIAPCPTVRSSTDSHQMSAPGKMLSGEQVLTGLRSWSSDVTSTGSGLGRFLYREG